MCLPYSNVSYILTVMSMPNVDIIQTLRDNQLFAKWFDVDDSWKAWSVFLKALFCIPMDAEEMEIFTEYTGRAEAPNRTKPFKESTLIVGRRGGKSQALAIIAVYLACFKDWRRYLAPGERGTIMIIAQDRNQAQIIFRYIFALINDTKVLAPLIKSPRKEMLELHNGINIEVHTASLRSVRGYAMVAVLLDEVAFWRDDTSANPDIEVIRALKPGMIAIKESMLLCASSPYARRGVLYQSWYDNYGKEDSDVLVWKAPTWIMNPTISQGELDKEFEKDSLSAQAEYGAEFRSDVETFLPIEALMAVINLGTQEIPPLSETQYRAFVDPSGGSNDSFTLSIAHYDADYDRVILDLIREIQPPFNPKSVVSEYAAVIKSYGLTTVTGDRYGGVWPGEQFKDCGVYYEESLKTKSDIYREFLPIINSKKCELLDHTKLIGQFAALERRTAWGGKDSIDHPPRAHDDLANAAAGAVTLAMPRFEGWDDSNIYLGPRLASTTEEFLTNME